MNIGVAIGRSARRTPEAVAVYDGDRVLTYAELDRRTDRLARVLLDRYGLAKGDRVALLLSNRAEVVEVLGAAAKAGLTYCGLNFRLAEAEYDEILGNADPGILITGAEHAEMAARLAERHSLPVVDVDATGDDGYETLLDGAGDARVPEVHGVRPEDDFCIVYTSGTTGRPKGVLFDNNAVLLHAMVAVTEYELDADSRWLVALPHNSSVQITLLPLLIMGGAIVFAESRGFDAHRFAAQANRFGATHTYLVPTMLFRLLDAGITAEEIASVTTIGYGAAPIPPPRVKELVERFGPRFIQLYGMAEVASIGTMLRKDDHVRALEPGSRILESCGRPSYAMDVRVVDDAGGDVGPGERGEVIFGSPHTMKGYYRDPERTADALIDGWMHSGDIGEIDEEGYIYIVDRKKDLIIRGGLNIVPSEIENVLYSHPAVLEAALVGVPDPEWGEALVAAVALKDGAEAGEAEIVEWCAEHDLPSMKRPESVVFREALPKNAVGKIAKNVIRDEVVAAREAGA